MLKRLDGLQKRAEQEKCADWAAWWGCRKPEDGSLETAGGGVHPVHIQHASFAPDPPGAGSPLRLPLFFLFPHSLLTSQRAWVSGQRWSGLRTGEGCSLGSFPTLGQQEKLSLPVPISLMMGPGARLTSASVWNQWQVPAALQVGCSLLVTSGKLTVWNRESPWILLDGAAFLGVCPVDLFCTSVLFII